MNSNDFKILKFIFDNRENEAREKMKNKENAPTDH